MVILDNALQERERAGNPVRLGIVGAGFIGRGMTLHVEAGMPGLEVAALSNRTRSKARQALADAGHDAAPVQTLDELNRALDEGRRAVTDDALLLCRSDRIDAVIETTGEIEFGARVAVEALEHGRHLVLMNPELDATLGPILKVRADRAGVVMTDGDGDQPGVIMNLLRYVQTLGLQPVLAGNMKGLLDHYRTPETQRAFAEQHGQTRKMVTSFADGTKLAIEMAVVANATGFRAGTRGMHGPRCDHVSEAPSLFSLEEMLGAGGLVDYVLGAEPGPGVFVLAYSEHPVKQQYLKYFKMGEGPLYVFYVPYHLPHLEAPLSAARAVLFQDATAAPLGAAVCETFAAAKRDLAAGETLDGIGGFASYGLLENAGTCRAENFLPIGLAEDCRLTRDVPKDVPITFDDVELPEGRLCDRLWREQQAHFAGVPDAAPAA